ncbi:hypothetical protein [Clostridium taeniosporum]|uniref:Uncharacterized protein n=1 Tax=Clostridium taeniosporum TaxID=394958 RepID=A0A1D7XPB5_9CLOT|nr:hypothetical protein [Clostridium taeniosporum]AOR25009.1 hypothetical protein BGI42_14780 [Clostridium taeniosporum]
MDFSIGNLISGAVGAIANVATAVVNTVNSAISGISGMFSSVAGAVGPALSGAMAALGVVDVNEDGELDIDDAEEFLEEKFKLLVGASIVRFGSGLPNTKSNCDDSYENIKEVNLNLEKRYILEKTYVPPKKTYISGETYITKKTTGLEPIPEYMNDNINLHKLPGEYKLEYLVKGVYDRFSLPFKEHMTFVANCYGLTPEYAELYGDFSVGMLAETGLTVSITGIKSAKNVISGNFNSESEFIAGSGIGNLGKGETGAGLSSTRSIDSKVLKELKKMGLDKKFNNAMNKGLAPRREGTSGIIKLTENEIVNKGGYEYVYKIKVPKAGGHTRVYGRINESGELIFDLILKK